MSVALPAAAQVPIDIGYVDTTFSFVPTNNGAHICGYSILANHLSHADPRTLWDLHIDEIRRGDELAVGIAAGSFRIEHGKKYSRPPLTTITFQVQPAGPVVPVQLVGTPNSDNGVKGSMDPALSGPIFDALETAGVVAVDLTYADGAHEVLTVHGINDLVNRGKTSLFNQCLRGILPRYRPYQLKPIP